MYRVKIFNLKAEVSKNSQQLRAQGKSIGLVPTMGALHQGHLALVKRALRQNDIVYVSIFVNPTQFNNAADLKKYPRTLDADVSKLKQLGKGVLVYAPDAEDIYSGDIAPEGFDFEGLEHEMEGKHRKGHFDGVGTIVSKLFEIVAPNRAYFGEKDFQQLAIVKKLVDLKGFEVKIVGCPIYREVSGLALSSRNQRLTKDERDRSSFIYKTLKQAKEKFGTKSANTVSEWVQKQFEEHPWLTLEYFEIADVKTLKPIKRKVKNTKYRAFIAVYANDVRLIDNIALN